MRSDVDTNNNYKYTQIDDSTTSRFSKKNVKGRNVMPSWNVQALMGHAMDMRPSTSSEMQVITSRRVRHTFINYGQDI